MKTGYKIFFIAIGLLLVGGVFALILRSGSPTTDPTVTDQDGGDTTPPPAEVQAKPPPPPPIFQLKTTESTQTVLPPKLQALTPATYTGCLADAATGEIIWHHRAEELVPIASMTKIMSTLVALEEIERRDDLTLQTGVKITQAAMDIGGSQVYLGKDEVFTLEALLQAMMIHSANDCAYAVAEATGPNFSVTEFVRLMNRRARELGMTQSRYFNPHGLPEDDPDRDCSATAAELLILAKHCLDRPKIMEWAGTWRLEFRPDAEEPLVMLNRNKLVNTCQGVTGLKTGFIRRSGSCVTITCTRNNRTLLLCVTGFENYKQRNTFVAELLDWAYTRP